MRLLPKLHLPRNTFSVYALSRRPPSPQRMSNRPQEVLSFEQEIKAIDPKVLAAAMGGSDQPPEEPLFSTFEEGFGYFTDAAVGRSLKQYEFIRKVSMRTSPSQLCLIIECSLVGLLPPPCGSHCESLVNSYQHQPNPYTNAEIGRRRPELSSP